MREILFRGKRIGDGEWVEGNLMTGTWYLDNRPITAISPVDDVFYPCYETSGYEEVITETVGQYTGLTDKNGKKIFEGDIFEFPDEVWESYYTDCGTEYNSWETKNRGVVGYCEDYGRFDFVQYLCNESSVNADLHENGALQFADFIRDLEVIGNIHDNPELLEVDNG